MVYDAIATMIVNVGLIVGGIGLGIIGLILGLARGMTNKSDTWALIFSSFAWVLALAIPSAPFAFLIFLMGAVGMTMAFNPLMNKIQESNILIMAVIAIIINLVLVLGFHAYDMSNLTNWESNLDLIGNDLGNFIGKEYDSQSGFVSDETSGLCAPGDTTCSSEALSGSFVSTIFDVFASVLAVPVFIGKAVYFAGSVLLAPLIIQDQILPLVSNTFVYYLIALYMLVWNAIILYKTIIFVLKRQSNL